VTPSERAERVLETKRAAARLRPAEFVEKILLGGEVYVFDWDPQSHADFLGMMEKRLGVGAAGIRLIGSAKLGFSLKDEHLLRRFRRDSDIDLVVVHPAMFDEAHLELAAMAGSLRAAEPDERRRLQKSRDNVFNGYLRPDQLPLGSRLHGEWFPRVAGPYEAEPARSHEVRAWLFKSLEHAAICYEGHFQGVQPAIQKLVALSEE
jgi:predicted nucleotidyltransferase